MKRNDPYCNYLRFHYNLINSSYSEIKRLKTKRSTLEKELIQFDKNTNTKYRNIPVQHIIKD